MSNQDLAELTVKRAAEIKNNTRNMPRRCVLRALPNGDLFVLKDKIVMEYEAERRLHWRQRLYEAHKRLGF